MIKYYCDWCNKNVTNLCYIRFGETLLYSLCWKCYSKTFDAVKVVSKEILKAKKVKE